jgi:hypothetical protein
MLVSTPPHWKRPTLWKRDRQCTVRASASQSHFSHRPMLPCHFQKTLTDHVDLLFSGLTASRGSNVAVTFCSLELQQTYLFFWRDTLSRRIDLPSHGVTSGGATTVTRVPPASLAHHFQLLDDCDRLQAYVFWLGLFDSITSVRICCILGAYCVGGY